ncbi:MAG: lipopolysaccharide kinase InaA family protein [Pseudomonadota bacterium]
MLIGKRGHMGLRQRKARILHGRKWGTRLVEVMIRRPEGLRPWMSQYTRILKNDEYGLVSTALLHRQPVFVKFYARKSYWRRFWAALPIKNGRAAHCFRIGQDLAARNILVPRPMCCVRYPDGDILMTEGLANAIDMQQLWKENPTRDRAEQCLLMAAHLIADLHNAGYVHGDCKFSNIVLSGQTCFLVDLDATRRGVRRQHRDIARFTLNAEELAVEPDLFEGFIQRYLALTGLPRKRLEKRAQRRLKKLRKRHFLQYGTDAEALL